MVRNILYNGNSLFPEYDEKEEIKKIIHKKKKKEKEDFFYLNMLESIAVSGYYQMPILKPYNGEIPTRLVPFNVAYANKDYDCAVHFFIADKHFLRVFLNPTKYLPFFQKCKAVIAPDLSQYSNMHYAMRIYHSYCNRAIAALWQANGVNVIPNVTWSLPDSYNYSFQGIPENSVIAINCNGINCCDLSKYLWYSGYKEALKRLHPRHILRYGVRMQDEREDLSSYFINERLNKLRNGR